MGKTTAVMPASHMGAIRGSAAPLPAQLPANGRGTAAEDDPSALAPANHVKTQNKHVAAGCSLAQRQLLLLPAESTSNWKISSLCVLSYSLCNSDK